MKHIRFAQKFTGLKEKNKRLSEITDWAAEMGVKGLETDWPWCAIFLNYVLYKTGYECMIQEQGGSIKGLNVASSRDFWKVGKKINSPKVGCVVVFKRGEPAKYLGHVGIVTEVISENQVRVISGNDGNEVTERIYNINVGRLSLVGYRELEGQGSENNLPLPLLPLPKSGNSKSTTTKKIIALALIITPMVGLVITAYVYNNAKNRLYQEVLPTYR